MKMTNNQLPAGSSLLSPCCLANIAGSLGDGVLIGSCAKCFVSLTRVNPRTGVAEWLDGKSPWSQEDFRFRPIDFDAPHPRIQSCSSDIFANKKESEDEDEKTNQY